MLSEYVRESNRIEGIWRDLSPAEITAHETLLRLYPEITVDDLVRFVEVIQPDAELRDKPHLNVRVGNHIAPQGGPQIVESLKTLLSGALTDDPYTVHQVYEHLHPFTDGNGRSGRALWLWMMVRNGHTSRALELGFLHNWYYQSLSGWRSKNTGAP